LGSVGLLGIGLLVYDLKLDAVFRKGEYTKPFYDYKSLNFRGFDRIRLNSATTLSFLLVQGDYKVVVNPRLRTWLRVRQEGSKLIITADLPESFDGFTNDYAVFISCPNLRGVETSGKYFVKGEAVVDRRGPNFWFNPTMIAGFRSDSLEISEDGGGNLALRNDRLGILQAVVGNRTALRVGSDNVIGGGEISVGDSATLILNGVAAKQLLKLKQP